MWPVLEVLRARTIAVVITPRLVAIGAGPCRFVDGGALVSVCRVATTDPGTAFRTLRDGTREAMGRGYVFRRSARSQVTPQRRRATPGLPVRHGFRRDDGHAETDGVGRVLRRIVAACDEAR